VDVQHDTRRIISVCFTCLNLFFPKNSKCKIEEIVCFVWASYFGVIGEGQVYGLPERGLAIDRALPSGEEFPRFREFWIR
ncbi:glucan biosynthesis protein, partial [Escherichia coli]|uniref:glucan biosynthesis protein n=1 Tax=Escherichia coli TaxID=562 RepID=UPI001939925A